MKKFLIALFSIASLFVFNNTKVNAVSYDGALGYDYSSVSGTTFNYYTDRDDVTVWVEVTTDAGDVLAQLRKLQGSEGYVALVTEANEGDTYVYKICSVSDELDCEYVLDPFSLYLNADGTKNVILDTLNFESGWNGVSGVSTTDYKRSIYAIDVDEFVKHLDTPADGSQLTYSVFDKMILSTTKGNTNVGINYIRSLGFSHIEMSGLYDENNYFAINGEYSNKSSNYSALTEYQTMVLEYKKYNMNIVLKTNFTNVSPELEKALLSISSTAVVDHKLNYSDPIVKRYITEVYKTWVNKYYVDGFYIEDSSMYGNQFLTYLLDELRKEDPSLFIYTGSESSIYYTSDEIQTLLLGSLMELDDKGIVNEKYTKANLNELVEAMFSGYYKSREGYENSRKTINNFGSEDGLDVYSKIKAMSFSTNDSIVLNKMKLVLATIYASSGTPRVIAGNEFMNSTLVNGTIVTEDRICIDVDNTLCYAMGENKDLDWDSLNKNGTMSKLFSNYRSSYYYQYPSLYTMENAESIEVNQDLLSKGVLYITFNYGGRKDGELVKSVLIINYSSQNQTLETISEKDYGSVSALFGQLRVNNGETIIAGQTFYVFTEVKEINIPQWVYIALGIALIGMVVGFRQLMIHLLKKKKGIDYDEFKKANKEKSWFRRRKKDTIVKEESLFETFFTSDPLIKERKEIAKKAKEERRLKKQKAKEDSLEQKESKEENQDTSAE